MQNMSHHQRGRPAELPLCFFCLLSCIFAVLITFEVLISGQMELDFKMHLLITKNGQRGYRFEVEGSPVVVMNSPHNSSSAICICLLDAVSLQNERPPRTKSASEGPDED